MLIEIKVTMDDGRTMEVSTEAEAGDMNRGINNACTLVKAVIDESPGNEEYTWQT